MWIQYCLARIRRVLLVVSTCDEFGRVPEWIIEFCKALSLRKEKNVQAGDAAAMGQKLMGTDRWVRVDHFGRAECVEVNVPSYFQSRIARSFEAASGSLQAHSELYETSCLSSCARPSLLIVNVHGFFHRGPSTFVQSLLLSLISCQALCEAHSCKLNSTHVFGYPRFLDWCDMRSLQTLRAPNGFCRRGWLVSQDQPGSVSRPRRRLNSFFNEGRQGWSHATALGSFQRSKTAWSKGRTLISSSI